MKLSLTNYILLSVLFLSQCTPEPEIHDKPVILPEEPKKEPYFVPTDRITKTFSTSSSPLTLKFNYNGSLMQGTRHNKMQARAIANATRSPGLFNQQFTFIIKGSNISINHRESLLNLLRYAGVRPSTFEVKGQDTGSSATVVENTMINKRKENTTTVIMQSL